MNIYFASLGLLHIADEIPGERPVDSIEAGDGGLEDVDEEEGIEEDLVLERRSSEMTAGPSGARRPVWEDPEDEAFEVYIAAINRLRKLRASEAETVLTGICTPARS